MIAHGGHLVNGSEGSEDTECTQGLQTVGSAADGQETNDADADNEEIKAVPWLSQVGVLVEHKAHRDDLDKHFDDEGDGEAEIDLLLDGRPGGIVIGVETDLVVG